MATEPAQNTFNGGLQMDSDPSATNNTVLTDAKNATMLTFNGNEPVLQNDMGNTTLTYTFTNDKGVKSVENVALPEGYVPMGMKEHGGVLYLVLYKKDGGRLQIGSFPAPEFRSETSEFNKVNKKTLEASKLGEDGEDSIKLIPIKQGSQQDSYPQITLFEQVLEPTQEISGYMFKGLNTEYFSAIDDPTRRRLIAPHYINATYQQDITDIVGDTLDLDAGQWHAVFTKKQAIRIKVIKPTKEIEYLSITEEDGDKYYWLEFQVFEKGADEQMEYVTYYSLYIPCMDETDGSVKYIEIGLEQIPADCWAEKFNTRSNEYYIFQQDGTNVGNLIYKSFFFPNTKPGKLALAAHYEQAAVASIVSTTEGQEQGIRVDMDSTAQFHEEELKQVLIDLYKNIYTSVVQPRVNNCTYTKEQLDSMESNSPKCDNFYKFISGNPFNLIYGTELVSIIPVNNGTSMYH